MKKAIILILGYIVFSHTGLFSQEDYVKVKGRYGECYQKKGFDSRNENQPNNTWGFKNVEIYEDYIYLYDPAYLNQGNYFLLINKTKINQIVVDDEGKFTQIYFTTTKENIGFRRITLYSSGSHDSFVKLMLMGEEVQEILWDKYELTEKYIKLKRTNQQNTAFEITHLRIGEIKEIRLHAEGSNYQIYIWANNVMHKLYNVNEEVYKEIINHCKNQN